MNADQISSAVRGFLLAVGTLLVSLGITKVLPGWWPDAVGGLAMLVSIVASQFHHAAPPPTPPVA